MPSPLISASWLASHLDSPGVRLFDTRFKLGSPTFGRDCYLAGHIPGAAFVDLEQDLHAPVRPDRVGGRHPLPEPAQFAAVFSRLGLSSTDHVIAYDDPSTGQGFYAPHLWWLLRYFGHTNVSVLDGGLPAWLSAGGTSESGTREFAPSNFSVAPQPSMIVDATEVATRINNVALIDSRAPERYRGEVEPLDWKAGHIPGALNRNWAEGIDSTGQWKPTIQQQQRFADVEPSSKVIVYCGSGVSAAGNLLALELAGRTGAQLYPGSWSDWVSDDSRPVATSK